MNVGIKNESAATKYRAIPMGATAATECPTISMGVTATGICPTDSMGATAVTECPATPVGMAGPTPTGTISTPASFGIWIATKQSQWQKAMVQESGGNHWPVMLHTGSRSRTWLRWLRRLKFIGT
jgi:hypothetical protein